MIAELDRKLSEQVNLILHHEDFQQLESAWRGLHYLVNNTETDEMLKIRFMNVSKSDLGKTLKRYKGTAWDQSPIFKKAYENEFGTPGGEPFGCIVGDYHFDHTAPDIGILDGMGKIAAAAHAPLSPVRLLRSWNMTSWQELGGPRDLTKIFQTAEYAPWRSLRDSENARYIGLAMPRFLSRLPYGAKTNPVDDFAFEEDTEGADDSKYVWSNSAYAMATNITRAFKLFRLVCMHSRSGVWRYDRGTSLPHLSDRRWRRRHEVSDRRSRLATGGRRSSRKTALCRYLHRKNSDFAVFIGAQSLQKPTAVRRS